MPSRALKRRLNYLTQFIVNVNIKDKKALSFSKKYCEKSYI